LDQQRRRARRPLAAPAETMRATLAHLPGAHAPIPDQIDRIGLLVDRLMGPDSGVTGA
jgi:hypothetical protein